MFNLDSPAVASGDRIHLNNIRAKDRNAFDTLDEEVQCLMDFCPWTPTTLDQLLAHEITLSYSVQDSLLLDGQV